MERRLAVIDLGSNSFRLVVFAAAGAWWRRTDEVYEAVRIGEGLAATGLLGDAGMWRAQATMDVFAHFCAAGGLLPEDVDAVATSAIRDARNAPEFLERAQATSGLRVRVLSREEEARYGYLAAVNSTTLSDGAVVDLGGGSMQLVRVGARGARELQSWPLGAVRMTERFLSGDGPAKPKQLKALRAHVAQELQAAPWLESAGDRLVGIGGTVRNLAAAAQRAAAIPEFGVQGHRIEAAALDELVERLAELPPTERGSVPGIKPSRGDLILAGAVVLQAVLLAGGFDALEATEAGLREGVFFERLLEGREPPLFDDVRRASVLNLAAQYGQDPEHNPHVAHVATLALGLFDDLAAAGLHAGDPAERELLWAASMLHDIGMTIDYDDHHKHSRYLILNAGLPGFDQREVALLGQAVRYHRKGLPSLGPFEPLAVAGDAERLERMALLLRLAEDLERSRDQAVHAARVAVADGSVRLALEAEEDVRVARWAAGRETDLFARAFGRELDVR
ncbi:MAG TPA: Ppx/GppA phosphatase family protein [Solirubrobacteraceae bacterium]|nr:Ppx/GppA phosphatase family protein [Solirubrobacteraceae bacterium]